MNMDAPGFSQSPHGPNILLFSLFPHCPREYLSERRCHCAYHKALVFLDTPRHHLDYELQRRQHE
jgi:hypothetical protein